jgi:cytochrome c peroxidase
MKTFSRFVLSTALMGLPLVAVAQEVQPLPESVKLNDAKVELGKKLYFDKRLSKDNTVSCASCHDLSKGGTDQLPTSTGIGGQKGPINAPTVYNSSANFVQFWNGRAKDLAEQALGPVENPKEMGELWPNVITKIKADAEYTKAFGAVYGGKITKENAVDAIAEFEKSLITPNAPFDKYLRGDKKAISAKAEKGWKLFQEKGCNSCHEGNYFGGTAYQTLSEDYFKDRGGEITEADLGRYTVTKDEADKYSFKTPMLRNIAVTAPYFHDGSVKTLDEAVKKMAKYQLGEELKPEEVSAIVAFLKTLTGEYEGVPLDKVKAQ